MAAFRNVPCIVCEMTNDEAILAVMGENLCCRDHIFPTEKAKALQQADAMSHQRGRLQNVDEGGIGERSMIIVRTRNGLNYIKFMV